MRDTKQLKQTQQNHKNRNLQTIIIPISNMLASPTSSSSATTATLPTSSSSSSSCRRMLLPHGFYSLIPTICTTVAWLGSLFQDGCDFSRLEGEHVKLIADLALSEDVPYLEVGFSAYRQPILDTTTYEWRPSYTGACLTYDEEYIQQDFYWRVSKAFAFMALVVGGGGTFFLWFSTCCVFSPATWRMASYQLLVASILQAFTFIWFLTSMCQQTIQQNDDVDSTTSQTTTTTTTPVCKLAWGSRADLCATILWLFAAFSMWIYYPKPIYTRSATYSRTKTTGDGLHKEDEMNNSSSRKTLLRTRQLRKTTTIIEIAGGEESSSSRFEGKSQRNFILGSNDDNDDSSNSTDLVDGSCGVAIKKVAQHDDDQNYCHHADAKIKEEKMIMGRMEMDIEEQNHTSMASGEDPRQDGGNNRNDLIDAELL